MLNICIAMAGRGSRMKERYGDLPKPLIKIKESTLVEIAIRNSYHKDANYIFVVLREHCINYGLDQHLESICKSINCKCSVIQISDITEGHPCSLLKAKDLINRETPLLSLNCDQILPTLSTECLLKQLEIDNADGSLLVFNNNSPKWSFVKLNSHGLVCNVAEKQPISDLANTGLFLWKRGSDFVKYAEQLIINNDRFNNEFYTSMIYNYMIRDSKIIKAYYTSSMFGVGTIEDIDNYIKSGY